MERGWSNWAGNQHVLPARRECPRTVPELCGMLADVRACDHAVRAVGSGHSFNDIALTPGCLVSLSRLDRVLDSDREAGLVRVQAGATIGALARELERRGLALRSTGDIDRQTLGGALATGTHGTGLTYGNLSAEVVELVLALADGSVMRVGPDDSQTLRAARVSLGALGITTEVTLRCVPSFRLRFAERAESLDRALAALPRLLEEHEHTELFVFPYSDIAQVRNRDRTDRPPDEGTVRRRARELIVENLGLALLSWVGRHRPQAIPTLNRVAARAAGERSRVAPSHHAFATERRVRFHELEFALPLASCADAVRGVVQLVRDRAYPVTLPLEVRFGAADDAYLSPAYGRATCYVACHVHHRLPWEPFLRDAGDLLGSLGGRPHWGKHHWHSAQTLATTYPAWDEFRAVRRRLDPRGVFANEHLRRVLG